MFTLNRRKIAQTLGLHVLDHQRYRLGFRTRVKIVAEIYDETTGEVVVASENEEELRQLYKQLSGDKNP